MMKKSLVILMLLSFSIGITARTVHLIGYNAPQDSTLQEKSFVPVGYQFQVGDTVIINESCVQYLTGEKPSQWVYGVRHIVGKVGGQRFQDGILLGNILSWIAPQSLKVEHLPSSNVPAQTDTTVVEEVVDTPAVVVVDTPVAEVVDTPVVEVVDTPAVEVVDTPNVEVADATSTDTCANTQINRFTIGARAGVASFLQKTSLDATNKVGCDALLDIQYAHYWLCKKNNKFGFLLGLSAGYAQGGLEGGISQQQYTVSDPDGWQAQYTVKVDKLSETDRQIQLEVPVMFSMITTHGFFLNLGPRFMLPVYTPYKQTIENPDIRAYFEKTDVEVRNEVITGLLGDDQLESTGKNKNSLKLNITLGLELGYEWLFKNNHSLGLGAYVNYGLYSMYVNDTKTAQPFIEVTPAIPSVVTSQSGMDSWTQKMGYVDGGIKIAYHFNWIKDHKK